MPQNAPINNSPILLETINSEQTYAESLIQLQKQFNQWSSVWWSVSAPKELVTISKLLPPLIDISERIKSNLLISMRFDVDAVAPQDVAKRAERAVERIQLIKLFAHVINDYASAINSYVLAMRNQTPLKMDNGALIMSTLIAPIQRGPRYDLLIAEILKRHADSLSQTNKDSCVAIQACIRKALAKEAPVAPTASAAPVVSASPAASSSSSSASSSSSSAPADKSYHFGDYSKAAYHYFFSKPPKQAEETKENSASPQAKQ